MSTKETLSFLTETLKKWQNIEKASIKMAESKKERTKNPLIRTVLDILERDSRYHFELQQMLIDSLTKQPLEMNVDDIGLITEIIDKHHKIEKDVIAIGQNARDVLGPKGGFVLQKFILNYLITDEAKHDTLLEGLSQVKKGMYPYGS